MNQMIKMKRVKNPELERVISELKKSSIVNGVSVWRKVAEDLSKPTRRKRVVNIYSIERHAKPGEIVVVPGKVLGTGELTKKVVVAAYTFSSSAYQKIKEKGDALSLLELVKKNPKGEKVRILG